MDETAVKVEQIWPAMTVVDITRLKTMFSVCNAAMVM